MTDIRMSPDVRTALGPDGVAKAGAVTLNNAICLGCEEKIYPNEPANVVVRIAGIGRATGRVAHVRYAHARCHASAVVEIPDARSPMPAAADDGMAMRMTAAAVDHGRSVLPTLIAEPEAPVYLNTGTGAGSELLDVLASRVLARGFSPVGRMRQAPTHADRWLATYSTPVGPDGIAQLTVMEPDGTLFYTGTIAPPPQWVAGVEQYGWSVLYVGKIGLAGIPASDQKAKTRLMREAAAAGRFVGARITVHHLE
ncbi:hypothetical protein ACMATS_38145 (plasmid) [Streptoverticillium reticulum]|uniref:hypothetical protein n=1 Tax=Streptoverticillium reticulum TaxID=1433415 RepID=UPI0039BFDBC8